MARSLGVPDGTSAREWHTQLFHFDGTGWRAMENPRGGALALAVPARGELWTVGRAGRAKRWSGGAWHEHDVGVPFDLLDVSADRGQVWVAHSGPDLLRWNGSAWDNVTSPVIARHTVQKVLAIDGHVIVPATWQGEAAIARFDGQEWRREVAGRGGIIRLAATGAGDLWGFGMEGRAFHYDGSRWRGMDLPASEYPIDAWAAAPDDVWLVGDEGMVLRWDGRRWTRVPSGTNAMHWAVWAAPGGPVYVGGDAGLQRLDRPRE